MQVHAQKARVLVVDDDGLVADTLAMILNFSGFDAVAAYSGEQALDFARLRTYDHLVTDVMMEPMNGIQVSLAMREIAPKCTVLLISGDERTSQILVDAIRDGHDFEILAKPVHPTLILDRLRAAPNAAVPLCPACEQN